MSHKTWRTIEMELTRRSIAKAIREIEDCQRQLTEAMNALMDEHGRSRTMYPGTNEHGESVYISIFDDKIVTMTSQTNGWSRKNIYYRDGSREETFER